MGVERSLAILSRSFAKASDKPLKYLDENKINYKLVRNSEPENIELIAREIGDAEAVIVGSDVINQYVMDRCPNLKLVSKHGVGLDSIDLELAKERGIKVMNTPDANNESVADLTILFMLYLLRNMNENIIKSETPDWKTKTLSNDLYEKTVGLIGFGKIGMAVANRLAGYNCKILVYDPYIDKSTIHIKNTYTVSLEELYRDSEIISLHMPLTEQTKKFINQSALDKMRKDVIIINTSRGAIIDEDALYEALVNKRMRAAGLDVYSVEPPVNNPILVLPNVICTPHIAPHTVEANYRMGMAASKNVVEFFNGEQ